MRRDTKSESLEALDRTAEPCLLASPRHEERKVQSILFRIEGREETGDGEETDAGVPGKVSCAPQISQINGHQWQGDARPGLRPKTQGFCAAGSPK